MSKHVVMPMVSIMGQARAIKDHGNNTVIFNKENIYCN